MEVLHMNVHASQNVDALAQFLTARVLERATGELAANIAIRRYGATPATRSLMASIGSLGGYLVPGQLDADTVISALLPRTVFRKHLPAENVINLRPHGNATIPRANSVPGASWIGESATVNEVTNPTFGDVNLAVKKSQVILRISNDLLRRNPDAVEKAISRQLLKAYSRRFCATYRRRQSVHAAGRAQSGGVGHEFEFVLQRDHRDQRAESHGERDRNRERAHKKSRVVHEPADKRMAPDCGLIERAIPVARTQPRRSPVRMAVGIHNQRPVEPGRL
jgi:hypothetical protein